MKPLPVMPAVVVTPAKGSGNNKRPTPQSSSVNKVILSKAKRTRTDSARSSSKSATKAEKVVLRSTPTRSKRLAAGSSRTPQIHPSPSQLRLLDVERKKQEKMMASEEKRKKADEKKQVLLKTRAQVLREEREARLEIIRKNKLAMAQEKAKEAAAAKALQPESSKAPQRKLLRRQVPDAAEKPALRTRGAKARAAAEAVKEEVASTSEVAVQAKSAKKKTTSKKSSRKGKKTAAALEEAKPNDGIISLSPIASANPAENGINQRLDATFTAQIGSPGQVMPSGSAAAKMCSTFNVSKKPSTPTKAEHTDGFSQYDMTPPPRSCIVENYDISKYIGSDDEDEQSEAANRSCHKPIPAWAGGKQFLHAMRAQFHHRPADEVTAQALQIFPAPLLPVRLEDMGLTVKARYAVRSSSVNWKKAAEIDEQMANMDGGNQEESA